MSGPLRTEAEIHAELAHLREQHTADNRRLQVLAFQLRMSPKSPDIAREITELGERLPFTLGKISALMWVLRDRLIDQIHAPMVSPEAPAAQSDTTGDHI